MSLPDLVFLRHTDGSPVGPFVLTALEVLFDARIVDERTPISSDGQAFCALADWPEVMDRLRTVKAALGRGENPWPDRLPSAEEVLPPTEDVEGTNLIRMLVTKSGSNATGTIQLAVDSGQIEVDMKDGKVVALHTDVPELVLSEYLLDRKLVDEATLAQADANAPDVSGDLGALLVAQGILQPQVYFEALVGWAKWVLGRCAVGDYGLAAFLPGDVETPSIPLGFDRLGLAIEIIRDGVAISVIKEQLMPSSRCAVIPSQVEGVSLEDCKLQPKELRVLNTVNGVLTLQDLLKELGGSEAKDRAVLRSVYFGEQAGFIVLGEDVVGQKERAEASRIESLFRRMELQNDFEILGIDERSSNDEVRAKFTDLARLYHPDTISPDADPALLEARNKMFAKISDVFERMEREDDRYRYAHELELGPVNPQVDEVAQVHNALQAETAFKKSEILVKVRKYDEALEQVDEAIRLNPRDTEFKIHRLYVQHLIASRQGHANPEQTIREVMALMNSDANIASGYLVLGHLHKAANKPEVARRYFEKVLEYDANHPVANQELRLANMRRDRRDNGKKRWL